MAKFGRNGAGPVKAAAPGALDRVKALEQFREEILRAMRQTLSAVEARLQSLEEINEALVNLQGRTQVEEEVKRLYIERAEQKSALEQKALEAAISSGRVKEAEVIGDLSLIVMSEVDKEGNKLYPSRSQMLLATIDKEHQAKFRGAKKGDVLETPVGSKLTILDIYDIVPPAQQPKVAATPPAPEGAGTETKPPPVQADLDDETASKLAEDLATLAEEQDAEEAEVEEGLLEDLAGQAAKIVPQPN